MTAPNGPGWYKAIGDTPGQERFWDGLNWTNETRPIEVAPLAAPMPVSSPAAHSAATLRKPVPWPWIGGAVGALILGIIIGTASSGGAKDKTVVKAGPTSFVTTTTTLQPTQVVSTATVQVTTTYTPPPPKTIGTGTYLVGSDIQPGLYKSAGDGSGSNCYWARLSSLNGAVDNIIDNNNTTGPAVVQVLPSDKALELSGRGCQFVKAG